MSADLARRAVAALSVAVGLGVALVLRPAQYVAAPAATPFVLSGSRHPAAGSDAAASALFGIQAARAVESVHAAAARPIVQVPAGQVFGALALMSMMAMGLAGLVAQRLAALNRTQQAVVSHANDAGLNARRLETRARLTDLTAIEIVAAQLAADALSQPLSLRKGLLVADALPTPFFCITDMAGDRYFFTTDPGLFRRMRIVRPSDPSCNVSRLSISARADLLAAWEALSLLKGFTHVAVPRRADWHLIVYRPLRERAPFWRRLRTALTARRLAHSVAGPLPERIAGQSGLLAEETAL